MKIAVFTKNRTNPAYDAARLGADRAANWLGAQTMHFVPVKSDDPIEQSALVDEALAMAPDAFVFTPVHASLVNAAIARINESGIPLVGFVNPIPAARCVSYVGSDDYRLGFELAQYLYAHLEGRGRVLVVSGPVASVTSIERVRAFRDAAKAHPGINVGGTGVGDYRRDTARDSVTHWLASNEGFEGCLVANDIMAIGVVDALRAAGRKAAVAGVNAIPEAIAAIRRGDMLVTADFNAMHMAFLATQCAVRHLRGEVVPAKIELPVEIVDRRNCHLWDLPYEQRLIPTLQETFA
ncbi:MAG: sugar ABC transporter substrate-binding protein [Betaproteobacteria bacterium]|nr:sugar ABC transporter substrate-binding protein [Betaproteobacteria bacterium]